MPLKPTGKDGPSDAQYRPTTISEGPALITEMNAKKGRASCVDGGGFLDLPPELTRMIIVALIEHGSFCLPCSIMYNLDTILALVCASPRLTGEIISAVKPIAFRNWERRADPSISDIAYKAARDINSEQSDRYMTALGMKAEGPRCEHSLHDRVPGYPAFNEVFDFFSKYQVRSFKSSLRFKDLIIALTLLRLHATDSGTFKRTLFCWSTQ